MKKKYLFIGVASLMVLGASMSLSMTQDDLSVAFATDPVDDSYLVADITEMNNFYAYNASVNYTSGSRDTVSVTSNGCFLFDEGRSNLEVVYNISEFADSPGAFSILARSQQTVNVSYSRDTGYKLLVYAHGVYQLYKQGTMMCAQAEISALGVDQTIFFRTVNCDNGSVHIVVDYKIGEGTRTNMFNIYDETDPIFNNSTNACYGVYKESGVETGTITFSSSYDRNTVGEVSLFDVSTPHNLNSSATTIEDDSVLINPNYDHANSGVSFPIVSKKSYSYTVDVKPVHYGGFDGSFYAFSIGSTKTEFSFPTPFVESPTAWTSCGYLFYWTADGWGFNGLYLSRGMPDEGGAWGSRISKTYLGSPTYTLDTTYSVKILMDELDNGFVRLEMYIDGNLHLHFIDKPSDDGSYQPHHLPSDSAVTVGACTTYANIFMRVQASGYLYPHNSGASALTDKTVLRDIVGEPTFIGVSDKAYKSGEIASYSDVCGYNTAISNSNIVANLTFTTIGDSLDFLLNYSGTFGSWETKGYKVRVTATGDVSLYKNDVLLIGTTTSILFNSTTETYKVSYTTQSLNSSNNAVLVRFAINDFTIIDFIDVDAPVSTAGVFAVIPDGYEGAILQSGETLPSISTDASENTTFVNSDVTLSVDGTYSSIVYYVDSSSTATATIVGDVLNATTTGNVVVYAICDGRYTREITVSIVNPEAVFINLPTTQVIVGGEDVDLDVAMNDSRTVSSKTFSIVEGSTLATIDAETGVVHVVAAGRIRVSATLIDAYDNVFTTSSSTGYIDLVPQMVFDTERLGKGLSTVVNASYNCEVGSEETTYELISGSEHATFVESTRTLTATSIGDVIIRVTFAPGATYSISNNYTVHVIESSLVIPSTPIIFGGETVTIGAKFSDDSPISNVEYHVVNGTGSATITNNGAITPVTAGTFGVYAICDGVQTPTSNLVVLPKVEVKNTTAIALGGERNLTYLVNCPLPQDEDIDVTYELVSGSECVQLNESTGHIKAIATGSCTVKVVLSADSFEVESAQVQIAVETPVVTIKSHVNDLTLGQSQTIDAELGNGEVEVTSSSIVFESGSDIFDVKGLTIQAVKSGSASFRVKINDYSSNLITINVSKLTATIAVGDMFVNETQNISISFNAKDYSPTVTYKFSEGEDLVSLENNVLTSSTKAGNVTLDAYVGVEKVASVSFKVKSLCALTGLEEDKEYTVGETISISYTLLTEVQVESIEYSVVSGEAEVKKQDDNTALLTIKGEGVIKVKVTVNQIDSEIVTVNGKKPIKEKNNGTTTAIIIGASVGGAAVVGGGVAAGIVIFKKKRLVK